MKNTQKKAPGKKVERKKEKKVRPTVRLWGYFKPYTAILAGGIICVVITTLSTLAVPWIIGKNLIDTVIMEKNLSLLNKIAILLLLLFTVRGFVSYLQTYFLSRVSYGVTTDLRNSAYEHLQGLSLGFYRRKRAGEIISRLTNDMNVIQTNLINELSSFFENFLTVAGVGIFIFYIHWR
ncbi:hypothetical protein H5U35_04590, partial [Candidatus Aerophobetes bacterium]|nr:hypothetical protein [Candidatus Aerophobetes bacterium]